MKFLADENFPRPLTLKIRSLGYSITTIQELKLTGASDKTVIETAITQNLTLLTFDKDFLTDKSKKLKVAIFDFPNTTTNQISDLIYQFLLDLESLNHARNTNLIFSNQGLIKN